MLQHALVTAFRNMRRFKSSTAVSIAGLALGLACFIAALGVVTYLANGDRHFSKASRIVIITESMHPRGAMNVDFARVESSPPVAEHLRVDFPELTVARTRSIRELPAAANDRYAFLQAATADAQLLDIFDFTFVETTSANPLAIQNGVVITEETAQTLFGSGRALGRTVTLQNAVDVTITGVIKRVPEPSHIGTDTDRLLRFDILMTENTFRALRVALEPNTPPDPPPSSLWGAQNGLTYALLPADGSLSARMLNDRLGDFTRKHVSERQRGMRFEHRAVPIASARLAQLDANLFHGNGLSSAHLILSLALLVLGIACVNYANLSVAQALVRSRELGLRRVLGASGWQLVTQQWMECGLLLLTALLIAMSIVFLGAYWFTPDAIVSPILTVISSGWFWLIVGSVCAAIGLVLGAYTSSVVVRAYPVGALRGSAIRRGSGFVTRLLVGIQFAVASTLVIGFIVIHQQHSSLRDKALLASSDPIVMLDFPWNSVSVRYETLKESLLRSPDIDSVSAVTRTPWSTQNTGITGMSRAPSGALISTLVERVQHDFQRVFDMRIVAGRTFDPSFNDAPAWLNPYEAANGDNQVVIDRATMERFGWNKPESAIDNFIYFPGFKSGPSIPIRIIGVVENKPLRLDAPNSASGNIYVLQPGTATNVAIRIRRDRVAAGLDAIDSTWKQLAPNTPIRRHFVDELFEREYKTLSRVSMALSTITLIGIFIAAMGLFGMALFVTDRRRHEIGVRKTLGANAKQIAALLLRDFSKPVLIANLLVWPVAFVVTQRYLDLFIQRVNLTPWPFALSLALTLFIAWLAVGSQTWRAARVNPAEVLRHE